MVKEQDKDNAKRQGNQGGSEYLQCNVKVVAREEE